MPETVQQYIQRIHSFVQGQDPLAILPQTPGRLHSLLGGLPDSQLRTRPASGRWSPLEILVHMSDVEIVVGFRTRFILGAPDGSPVPAFDQDSWQQVLRYNEREFAPTLDAFAAARDNNLRLYRSLTEDLWNKYGMHSERGKETVRTVVTMNAGHDLNHLRQVEAILGKNVAASA